MNVKPLRVGLHYSPPTIIVEYMDDLTGKRYHRRIGLPYLKVTDDSLALAARVKVKFQAYLGDVSKRQLERLIQRLQDNCDDALLGNTPLGHSPTISDALIRSDLSRSSPETVVSRSSYFEHRSFKPSDWNEDIQL
jgi:CEP19-like protein